MNAVLGQPMDRRDGKVKVTGSAKFSAEWPLEKMAHAVLVPATIAKGSITKMDTAAAEKAPGVLAVMTHLNAPKMKETKVFDPASEEPGSAATTIDILHTDQIGWEGQPVAVVVAESIEQARHAADLVKVAYKPVPHIVELQAGREKAFAPKSIMGEPPEIHIGGAEDALTRAEVSVDERYTTPRENHNPIEPHATIAHWEAGKLTVYDGSQFIHGVRKMLAEKFSLAKDDVRVLSPFVGGGFGCKGLAWPHVQLCVAAAKAVERPVKLALSRQHYYRTVGGRTETDQRVALGAGRDGKLTALIHTGITTTSTSNLFTEQFTFPARHLYAAPNLLVGQKVVRLDIVPPTFMRAPGEAPGMFALESALDELAHALKTDPIELRLRNIGEKDPTTKAPYSIRHSKEMFQIGAERFGWSKRTPEPRSMKDGRWLVGHGVAGAYYPVYQNPTEAHVRVSADGTAVAMSAAHEMGMGTVTAQAQNLASTLGLPVEQVRFEIGDSEYPFAAVAGGSSQTVSIGAAVIAACAEVKKKLLVSARADAASVFAGVSDADVQMRDGGLFVKDTTTGARYADILGKAGQQSVDAHGKSDPGDTAKRFSLGSYGAVFCEVRVDERFGRLRVKRVVGCYDTGRILNAKTAASQIRGGVVMGIGMALMEETLADPRFGRILNPNLGEYHIPVHADVPEIEVHFLDKPDPHTPMGAHGIGEIGITGIAAALANAVFHATGRRIRELPITTDKLMG